MERLNEDLVQLLRCPVTGEALRVVDAGHLLRINDLLAEGALKNRVDELPLHPLLGGLVNASGSCLFPVYEHGPTLIADEAIVGDFSGE